MANEFKIKNGAIISGSVTGVTEPLSDDSTKLASTSWVRQFLAGYQKTAYDGSITGLRNGVNTVFTLPDNYEAGSAKVYLNGLRMTPGVGYDYVETSPNKITFNYAPESGSQLVVDYYKVLT